MHNIDQGRAFAIDSTVDSAIEDMPDEIVIEQICLGHSQAYEIIMRRHNQRLCLTQHFTG